MYHTLKKTAALLMVLLLMFLCGCSAKTDAAAATQTANKAPAVPYRQTPAGIQTLLVASLKEFEPNDPTGYRNPSKADLLMMMIIDEAGHSITSLQLNPDTMIPFTPQGAPEAIEIPLGEAFSYGSGGSDSCLNEMKAITQLLGGLSIQHYMFFTLDSIGIVNKLIGGVEVEVQEEFPSEYPAFRKGSTVSLIGNDVLPFFDYRDIADVSNTEHMGRQQQYMMKSYTPFTQHVQEENFLTKLTVQLGDRLSTDLTLSQMVQMMELMGACTLDETIHLIPGSAELVSQQFQFRANADDVTKILDQLVFH